MQRPSAARETLGFSPLVNARWADAPGVERVPLKSASAEPFVLFTRRPAAERAADARRFGRAGLLLFVKLAVYNIGQHGRSHNRITAFFGRHNAV